MLEGVQVSLHDLKLPGLGRGRVGRVGVSGGDAVELERRVMVDIWQQGNTGRGNDVVNVFTTPPLVREHGSTPCKT